MTQLERIQKDISQIKNATEFVGYLHGIEVVAAHYCINNNLNEEVYKTENVRTEVTINGMIEYLESE